MGDLAKHRAVQAVAKSVLATLGPTISPDDTEKTIAARATTMLSDRGISDTWYYDCPVFVLLGSRSCLSLSGREYKPSEEPVGSTNLITVDLSPLLSGIWGDCARSFVVEDGAWTSTPSLQIFSQGVHAEAALHDAMQNFVTPRTSFEELFRFANVEIQRLGKV